jgi:hypothetical protein
MAVMAEIGHGQGRLLGSMVGNGEIAGGRGEMLPTHGLLCGTQYRRYQKRHHTGSRHPSLSRRKKYRLDGTDARVTRTTRKVAGMDTYEEVGFSATQHY